ncbi:4-hydroxy-3-methylbut-2-enyl diphosphate reductase [Adlercreutzia faecimuris]|uniref:4-hydroxy-3-methylbut-2-enyl diphosphate reductase n=1 Tax=Adlercreutzia faecimuris TaxID=2897341 RepID=A0ABS9WIJ2_9ACTN|nr:4-hydroxy-3-methylbut-2-enyl diphosphate reductase [Adlercreutzia sp. JBNU-10]MCI2242698.1 4-hydroxy-3-methylbut-2-enyl diphosphate reductase [Adlercreutzia sp. JBNU-10]
MEVIRAGKAGACYGVQRALDMADEVLAAGGRAYTLGPLIHNPQVVADLAARGAEAVGSVGEVAAREAALAPGGAPARRDARDADASAPALVGAAPAGAAPSASAPAVPHGGGMAAGVLEALWADAAPAAALADAPASASAAPADAAPATPNAPAGAPASVVIRSHGVTPDVLDAVEEAGFTLVDATCPHVSRAQHAAAELARAGCRVVVLGEARHPEVEGLTAWAREAGGKVDVVAGPDDIPEGLYDPIGVVAQTTQRRENLDAVVAALRERGLDPLVKNTICSATGQRQQAAAELAGTVDAMVVIGGRNSSNTTRLAEICAQGCPRAFHIESADELDPAWFSGCARVGVTAGASTPEDQIAAVEARLRSL